MVISTDMGRTLMLSLWLPVGVVVLGAIRFGPGLLSMPADQILPLALAWPGGIPLTLCLQKLFPLSRPAAYVCAAVLCPLSVAAATVGGLLGPLGIWIYAAIVSLPAWLALWVLRWRAARAAA